MTAKTVADLIELLKQLPPETQLGYVAIVDGSYSSYSERRDLEEWKLNKYDNGSIWLDAEGLDYSEAVTTRDGKYYPPTLTLGG